MSHTQSETRLLSRLDESFNSGDQTQTPQLDQVLLWGKYHLATKRLWMLDYDGTLTPIVEEPHAAVPTERLRNTLKALVNDERNHVWIISGRDQEFL
jgi:trehalose 6-phosphate synthase/phosphatase